MQNKDRPYYRRIVVPLVALIIISITTVDSSHAAAVSKSTATSVAETYARYGLAVSSPDVYAVGADPWVDNGDTIAYIVHMSNGGDCIAGADDRLLPVALYNPGDRIDTENPGFRSCLDEMAARLRWLKDNQREGTLEADTEDLLEDRRRLWDEMAAGSVRPGTLDRDQRAAPVTMSLRLNARWDQHSPYNEECPIGEDSLGEECRTVVGCNATALAQILYYWKWPNWPYTIPSYDWDGDQSCGFAVGGGTLSVPPNTLYDWENILDDCHFDDSPCSTVNEEAVAELCYEVAVALETDFGCCASYASSERVPTVLKDYFRYKQDAAEEDRHLFSLDVLVNEIQFLRPVHISGQTELMGGSAHSWVIFGYDKTSSPWSFHFNMGSTSIVWRVLDECGYPFRQRYTFRIAPDSYTCAGGGIVSGNGSPTSPWLDLPEALANIPDTGYQLILKAGLVHDASAPLVLGSDGKSYVIRGEAVVIR
jgi:hypothetical protein